jgi:lipoate---protein ligase
LPAPAHRKLAGQFFQQLRRALRSALAHARPAPAQKLVVGYANKVETEVKVAACTAQKVPIFRRCSGGGTVLQGPGCLNYTLILQITENPPLASISGANRFIMEQNRVAIESEIRSRTPDAAIAVQGHTDLTLVTRHPPPVTPRKFSGNSQRRHRRFLLFHGTFLLNFDLPRVNELLHMPSRQPDYRHHRGHTDFLTNLNLPAQPEPFLETYRGTVEPFLQAVTQRLIEQVNGFDPQIVPYAQYALNGSGKHLRPTLVALAANALRQGRRCACHGGGHHRNGASGHAGA